MNNNVFNITIIIDTDTGKRRKITTQQPVAAARVRLQKPAAKNKEKKEVEKDERERKKSDGELNKPTLNKHIRREVIDEDENYDDNNNDDAVVFSEKIGKNTGKNKQTRNRHTHRKR